MKRPALALGVAAVAIVAFALTGCPDGAHDTAPVGLAAPPRPRYETASIDIAGHAVTVEIADTARRRQYGLMFHEKLPDDRGMLFIYPLPETMHFWMRNCPEPLDIAYLNDAGQILGHERMEAFEEHGGYSSPGPVRFAVELPAGWFDRTGVKTMEWVRMPVELLTERGESNDLTLDNIPRILTAPAAAH